MFSLLLTGLLATSVALASDDSSGATKTVLASVPSLLRPPVLQGSRFVVTNGGGGGGQPPIPLVVAFSSGYQQQEQVSPVRAATSSPSESSAAAAAVLPQLEVPQQQQEQQSSAAGLSPSTSFYSPAYDYDYSQYRRYVPSYVHSPPPYFYPSSSGAVRHPFLQSAQQSPVIELDVLSPPVQILVRTPTGVQIYRPVPYSRPPVLYFVASVSGQEQDSKQTAAQEQAVVTKVETVVPASSAVANETQNSSTSPEVVSLASSGSVTEVVPSSGLATAETKVESSAPSDSF